MPPKKIINNSRPVGGKRRGRPPKQTEQPPAPPLAPDWSSPANTSDWVVDGAGQSSLAPVNATGSIAPSNGNGKNGTTPSIAASKAQSYTGLNQIQGSLKIPEFKPDNYLAADLFSDSSNLPRTSKEKADEIVQAVEEKRHTMRIVTANLQLNQDVVKAGNEYQKLEGLAIDYATNRVKNETKFINYQTAEVGRDIAINKYDQELEKLRQGEVTLNGMRQMTEALQREWDARVEEKNSKISTLKSDAAKLVS